MSQSARAVAIAIEKHAIPFDENGFVDWLIDASPGDKVVYYRGHLGHDRMPSAKVLERKPRAELHAVAIRVMVTAAQGLVLPVQKRVWPRGVALHRGESPTGATLHCTPDGPSDGDFPRFQFIR